MRSRSGWVAAVAAWVVGMGCVVENVTPPPVQRPVRASTSTSTSTATATATATPPATPTPTTDFYSCQVDADCVAVAKVGCCSTGEKEAVTSTLADSYRKSFTCAEPVPCPRVFTIDPRVAECNNLTRMCEMVKVEDIRCGGFTKNQHQCPDPLECKLPKTPDVAGTCVK